MCVHCVAGAMVGLGMLQQVLKPSFRRFVLANLAANHVVAMPVLYRLRDRRDVSMLSGRQRLPTYPGLANVRRRQLVPLLTVTLLGCGRRPAGARVDLYALAAGVHVLDGETLRPANGRDFRHGAVVNQVWQGVPLSEVQQQLGHARINSTSVYAKLANPERRAMADRVTW